MDQTIKEIRGAIFALQARADDKPPDPRTEVVGLVEEMTAMLGFPPSLRLGLGLRTLDDEELFRQVLVVLREALSNMARHADATRADVTVDDCARPSPLPRGRAPGWSGRCRFGRELRYEVSRPAPSCLLPIRRPFTISGEMLMKWPSSQRGYPGQGSPPDATAITLRDRRTALGYKVPN
jgi:hypothetical protein